MALSRFYAAKSHFYIILFFCIISCSFPRTTNNLANKQGSFFLMLFFHIPISFVDFSYCSIYKDYNRMKLV